MRKRKPKIGRPPVDGETLVRLDVRVSPRVLSQLEREALADSRSVSSLIRLIIDRRAR